MKMVPPQPGRGQLPIIFGPPLPCSAGLAVLAAAGLAPAPPSPALLRLRVAAGLSAASLDAAPLLRLLEPARTEGVSPSKEVLAARDWTFTLSTIMEAKRFTFSMNCPSAAVPLAISLSRRSHCPVISGEVSSSMPAPRINSIAVRPFWVIAIFLPCIST
ncbi:hypothetical protein D3C80_1454020 [compost metagenome]